MIFAMLFVVGVAAVGAYGLGYSNGRSAGFLDGLTSGKSKAGN